MSGEEGRPAPVARKGGTLIIRDVTGLQTHPASDHARVINSCRDGHEEVIEVRYGGFSRNPRSNSTIAPPIRFCGGSVSGMRMRAALPSFSTCVPIAARWVIEALPGQGA